MPCLLKQQTSNSPGIITFTHNEALNGVPFKSKRAAQYLTEASNARRWLFGVHIQGDCSHLKQWPLRAWQSFIMWPQMDAPFLANVPWSLKTPLTCINFMPRTLAARPAESRLWDLCVISRASSIKRITETLYLVRRLLDLKPDLKVVFVVPDARRQELGSRAYRAQHIDENYFSLPRAIFSANELRNLSFLSSSQRSFGTFPLSDDLVAELLARSHFMLLTSHSEGVPRVIAESLLVGTPCLLSENLRSGLNMHLTTANSIMISDDIEQGARQILDGLMHHDRFAVDRLAAAAMFSETEHKAQLQAFLSERVHATGARINGNWHLDDLHLRLACHGQKHNCQFMNRENLLLDWMARAESLHGREPDEDFMFGSGDFDDNPLLMERVVAMPRRIAYRLSAVMRPIRGAAHDS